MNYEYNSSFTTRSNSLDHLPDLITMTPIHREVAGSVQMLNINHDFNPLNNVEFFNIPINFNDRLPDLPIVNNNVVYDDIVVDNYGTNQNVYPQDGFIHMPQPLDEIILENDTGYPVITDIYVGNYNNNNVMDTFIQTDVAYDPNFPYLNIPLYVVPIESMIYGPYEPLPFRSPTKFSEVSTPSMFLGKIVTTFLALGCVPDEIVVNSLDASVNGVIYNTQITVCISSRDEHVNEQDENLNERSGLMIGDILYSRRTVGMVDFQHVCRQFRHTFEHVNNVQ